MLHADLCRERQPDRLQRGAAVLRRQRRQLADRPEPAGRGDRGAQARRRPRARGDRGRSLRAVLRLRRARRRLRAARRHPDPGRRRVARRDLPRGALGLAGAARRAVVQRQQDHHDERWRGARRERRRAPRPRAEALDAGPRAGAALRAHRDRLQLPPQQPPGRGRPGAARGAARARGGAAANQRPLPRASRRRAGHRLHARRDRRHVELLAHVHHRRSRLVRRRPGADQARARGGGHRVAPGLEADAPAARVRGQPDLRRRRLRPPVRAGALPAERLGDDRRRSGPRRQPPCWRRAARNASATASRRPRPRRSCRRRRASAPSGRCGR